MKTARFDWLNYATPYDKLIIALCAVLSIGSLFAPLSSAEGSRVRIVLEDVEQYQGPLFQAKKFTYHGKHGPIVIETGDQGVRVVRSNCPHQICVNQGWRKGASDLIVCVPNQLVITILGQKRGEHSPLDSITR